MPIPDKFRNDPSIRVLRGVCPHDCPDSCAWEVAVDGTTGRAVAIGGDPTHPVTRGRLCGKVDRYLERTYHAGRLLTPLRRVGPKGSGQFEPVSWEVALREIADETVKPPHLKEAIVTGLQKVRVDEEDETEELASLSDAAEALRLTAAAPPRPSPSGGDYE